MNFYLIIILSFAMSVSLQAQTTKWSYSPVPVTEHCPQQAKNSIFKTSAPPHGTNRHVSNAPHRRFQSGDPQSPIIIRKRGDLYLEGSRLKPQEVEKLFDREQLHISYKNAVKLKRLSWLPICCGVAITGSVLGFSGRLDDIPVIAGSLIGAACLGTGIWINVANTRKIKAIVNEYNFRQSSRCQLGLVATPNGIGVGLAF